MPPETLPMVITLEPPLPSEVGLPFFSQSRWVNPWGNS